MCNPFSLDEIDTEYIHLVPKNQISEARNSLAIQQEIFGKAHTELLARQNGLTFFRDRKMSSYLMTKVGLYRDDVFTNKHYHSPTMNRKKKTWLKYVDMLKKDENILHNYKLKPDEVSEKGFFFPGRPIGAKGFLVYGHNNGRDIVYNNNFSVYNHFYGGRNFRKFLTSQLVYSGDLGTNQLKQIQENEQAWLAATRGGKTTTKIKKRRFGKYKKKKVRFPRFFSQYHKYDRATKDRMGLQDVEYDEDKLFENAYLASPTLYTSLQSFDDIDLDTIRWQPRNFLAMYTSYEKHNNNFSKLMELQNLRDAKDILTFQEGFKNFSQKDVQGLQSIIKSPLYTRLIEGFEEKEKEEFFKIFSFVPYTYLKRNDSYKRGLDLMDLTEKPFSVWWLNRLLFYRRNIIEKGRDFVLGGEPLFVPIYQRVTPLVKRSDDDEFDQMFKLRAYMMGTRRSLKKQKKYLREELQTRAVDDILQLKGSFSNTSNIIKTGDSEWFNSLLRQTGFAYKALRLALLGPERRYERRRTAFSPEWQTLKTAFLQNYLRQTYHSYFREKVSLFRTWDDSILYDKNFYKFLGRTVISSWDLGREFPNNSLRNISLRYSDDLNGFFYDTLTHLRNNKIKKYKDINKNFDIDDFFNNPDPELTEAKWHRYYGGRGYREIVQPQPMDKYRFKARRKKNPLIKNFHEIGLGSEDDSFFIINKQGFSVKSPEKIRSRTYLSDYISLYILRQLGIPQQKKRMVFAQRDKPFFLDDNDILNTEYSFPNFEDFYKKARKNLEAQKASGANFNREQLDQFPIDQLKTLRDGYLLAPRISQKWRNFKFGRIVDELKYNKTHLVQKLHYQQGNDFYFDMKNIYVAPWKNAYNQPITSLNVAPVLLKSVSFDMENLTESVGIADRNMSFENADMAQKKWQSYSDKHKLLNPRLTAILQQKRSMYLKEFNISAKPRFFSFRVGIHGDENLSIYKKFQGMLSEKDQELFAVLFSTENKTANNFFVPIGFSKSVLDSKFDFLKLLAARGVYENERNFRKFATAEYSLDKFRRILRYMEYRRKPSFFFKRTRRDRYFVFETLKMTNFLEPKDVVSKTLENKNIGESWKQTSDKIVKSITMFQREFGYNGNRVKDRISRYSFWLPKLTTKFKGYYAQLDSPWKHFFHEIRLEMLRGRLQDPSTGYNYKHASVLKNKSMSTVSVKTLGNFIASPYLIRPMPNSEKIQDVLLNKSSSRISSFIALNNNQADLNNSRQYITNLYKNEITKLFKRKYNNIIRYDLLAERLQDLNDITRQDLLGSPITEDFESMYIQARKFMAVKNLVKMNGLNCLELSSLNMLSKPDLNLMNFIDTEVSSAKKSYNNALFQKRKKKLIFLSMGFADLLPLKDSQEILLNKAKTIYNLSGHKDTGKRLLNEDIEWHLPQKLDLSKHIWFQPATDKKKRTSIHEVFEPLKLKNHVESHFVHTNLILQMLNQGMLKVPDDQEILRQMNWESVYTSYFKRPSYGIVKSSQDDIIPVIVSRKVEITPGLINEVVVPVIHKNGKERLCLPQAVTYDDYVMRQEKFSLNTLGRNYYKYRRNLPSQLNDFAEDSSEYQLAQGAYYIQIFCAQALDFKLEKNALKHNVTFDLAKGYRLEDKVMSLNGYYIKPTNSYKSMSASRFDLALKTNYKPFLVSHDTKNVGSTESYEQFNLTKS